MKNTASAKSTINYLKELIPDREKGGRLASMQIAEMSLDVKYTFASLTPRSTR
jgi:hypothetical protein